MGMIRRTAGLASAAAALAAVGGLATAATGGAEGVVASADLVDATGATIGEVSFQARRDGVVGVVDVELPADSSRFHGFHLHANNDPANGTGCVGPAFTSADGHWNPAGVGHGNHAGDLPPLVLGPDGRSRARFDVWPACAARPGRPGRDRPRRTRQPRQHPDPLQRRRCGRSGRDEPRDGRRRWPLRLRRDRAALSPSGSGRGRDHRCSRCDRRRHGDRPWIPRRSGARPRDSWGSRRPGSGACHSCRSGTASGARRCRSRVTELLDGTGPRSTVERWVGQWTVNMLLNPPGAGGRPGGTAVPQPPRPVRSGALCPLRCDLRLVHRPLLVRRVAFSRRGRSCASERVRHIGRRAYPQRTPRPRYQPGT